MIINEKHARTEMFTDMNCGNNLEVANYLTIKQ
jgi:hypothetical protein